MKIISFEKSVGGVLYRKQQGGHVFLLVKYRSGQWDFPKGHVEEGETEKETLEREIFEETKISNLTISPNFRMSVRYFYRARGNEEKERLEQGRGIYIFKQAVYFVAQSPTEHVEIDFENRGFVWASFDEAMKRIKNSGSKKILRAAQSAINGKKKMPS